MKLIKQEIKNNNKFIIFKLLLIIWENNIIVIIDGKNLNTDDDGIKIALLKFAYPILPKISKQENSVKIEKGKFITFANFLINKIKKINIKIIINITITILELKFVNLVN